MREGDSARWERIETLYHEALAQDRDSRAAFLTARCAGDAALRQEVESLLRCDTAAEAFLGPTAFENAAADFADDERSSRIGQRIGGYEILSLLGAGGMGEVYRAKELRLERDVALKLLAPAVSRDPDYLRRFEEEARSASVLNHPNIVTIYAVGEDRDVAYIAMELVEGRTLRESNGVVLPLAHTLDLALQLASALAAAHHAGIVHRDLKPENVMVTADGRVKVLDFGIAKRASQPASEPAPEPIDRPGTSVGLVLGTVGYMSPEQALGRPVSFTSDQFSFGAILYELITGRRAFDRTTRQATIRAIVSEQPVSVDRVNANADAAVCAAVGRCLAKNPADRYSDTEELVRELRAARERMDDRRHPTIGRRRAIGWLLTTAAGAAALVLWREWPRGGGARSLAVLPFVNAANDDEAEYLCDGLTTALIQRIAPLPSLTVMARSLVFNFKRKTQDPRAIGRQLHVDAVLSGSVERQRGRVVVVAELLDVASGRSLWSRSYDRDASDLMVVEGEIATAIVDEGIRLSLTTDQRRKLVRRPTSDAEAYRLYLAAVHAYTPGTEEGYLKARTLLEQAIGRDATFARAYVGLATTYAIMAVDGYERPTEAWLQSGRAVRQALRLDPDLPDAQAALASESFWFDWDFEKAEREWAVALESISTLDPNFLRARALQLWALGRPRESLDLARKARRIDPLSSAFKLTEADYLFHTNRQEEAVGLYEEVIRDEPANQDAYMGVAEVRRAEGRYDDALNAWRRGPAGSDESLKSILARASGREGYRALEASAAQLEVEALSRAAAAGVYVSPLDFARAFARRGDVEHALARLDAAFADRAAGLTLLNVDPVWDGLRTDPRFVAAVKRVGLP